MKYLAKPFVKWAGGKYKLSNTIIEESKNEINFDSYNTYLEPFVGGGGMFFSLVSQFDFKKKIIGDINIELINVYKQIRDNIELLIEELNNIQNEYNSKTEDKFKKEYFYKIRDEYNETILNKNHSIRQAALFIALNKLGFNGLYRVNTKGLFNVPFGKKKKANIYDKNNLYAVNEVLQDTEIYDGDYAKCLDYVDDRTLVYFDSPYRPLPGSPSFTSYSKDDFNDEDQKHLAKIAREVVNRGGSFLLSNSDPRQIDENDLFFEILYRDFIIKKINAQRVIGANKLSRGTISEILVIGKG